LILVLRAMRQVCRTPRFCTRRARERKQQRLRKLTVKGSRFIQRDSPREIQRRAAADSA